MIDENKRQTASEEGDGNESTKEQDELHPVKEQIQDLNYEDRDYESFTERGTTDS